LCADGRPTRRTAFSSRKKRMPSPMTYPSGLTATYCFALSTANFSNEFTPVSESSRMTSGPSIWRSVMWCDWSKSADISFQATCSSRQFVNSAGTAGYTYGPICEFRAISAGLAASCSLSSRLRLLISLLPPLPVLPVW
jgi:hypothetical protein